jgi:hypothetical protein
MAKRNIKKQGSKAIKENEELLKRIHSVSFQLNDKEKEAIESYCEKYKIKNRSQFLRKVVFKTILEQFMKDYPTLFE